LSAFAIEPVFLMAILAMGLATYATRVSGYLFLRGREVKGRAKAAMDAVPPAILMAVIAPSVFLGTWIEWTGAAIATASAVLRLPLLATIALATSAVAALRALS
jgi:uncharacterized membrane protein